MKIRLKPLELIAFMASALVTWGTIKGTVQEKIHFEGVANEIAFLVLATMLTIGFFIASVEIQKREA